MAFIGDLKPWSNALTRTMIALSGINKIVVVQLLPAVADFVHRVRNFDNGTAGRHRLAGARSPSARNSCSSLAAQSPSPVYAPERLEMRRLFKVNGQRREARAMGGAVLISTRQFHRLRQQPNDFLNPGAGGVGARSYVASPANGMYLAPLAIRLPDGPWFLGWKRYWRRPVNGNFSGRKKSTGDAGAVLNFRQASAMDPREALSSSPTPALYAISRRGVRPSPP